MTSADPHLMTLFSDALKCASETERSAYLDRACAGDASLRGEVESLLKAHAEAGGFLEAPASNLDTTIAHSPAESPGTVIGPYKLLQQIGEGGMGTVFMAEQTQPVQRRVALKIIKPGMDTKLVIARFEAERQALAVMDHPNIAKVFDAGTTENGRPYFVMELVKGVPLTKYCDEHRLTPRQRLELFVPVCQAIQHAHQKGIIHRDVKPSNVLVAPYDGKPVVKVIDFGVAKATGQRLTDKTLFTDFGAVVGTMEYMSPEQAELNNQDIDTRSDIYSLGVLLYELLTGTTPLSRARLKGAAFTEMLRMIREEEPPKPSTRLSESKDSLPAISAQRQTEPAKLTRQVRGELDWIVMKALDKDRSRRYETANGLAMDLQRYLTDEPVQACPPTARYRLRKFLRRNKGPVVAVSLVTAALLVGIVGTTGGMMQAEQRRSEADNARRESEKARRDEAEQRGQAEAHLYDSLVGEARALRLARVPGYRVQAWERLRRAALLDTPKRDLDQLRSEAAACLGDFVGLEPTVLRDLGKGLILSIALHPRVPLLALGFSDGTISVHRLPDGDETARWRAHPEAGIVSVTFHPEGTGLASAASDGTITSWGPSAEGEWARQLTFAGNPRQDPRRYLRPSILRSSNTVVFTPDGQQLAVSSRGGSTVWFWRTRDGQPMPGLEARGLLEGPLALSPDGKLLAAGSTINGEPAVQMWEMASRKVVQEFLPHLLAVRSLAFSPDSKLLACGCDSGMAVFETSTAQRRLRSLSGNISALAFTPDGQWLASGGQTGSTRLWDLITNREVATLIQPVTPGEPYPGMVYSIALSSDGKTIVSASTKAVVLWNSAEADERRLLKRFARGVPGLAFSPRGDLLASITHDGMVSLWNSSTGHLVRSLDGGPGVGQSVAFSPDGRLLAAGGTSERESVRIWDIESGRTLAALDPKLGILWSVDFSRDGRYFAVGGEEGWGIWKVNRDRGRGSVGTGLLLQEMTRRQIGKGVGTLCFTRDGSLLAWVEHDNTFHLWDVAASNERPTPIPRLKGFVLAIRLHPNGLGPPERDTSLWLNTSAGPEMRDVATGIRLGPEMWDVATGIRLGTEVLLPEVKALPDELKWGWCVALSPDRTKWAVGGGDGTLALWDLAKVRARLEEAGLGWDTAKR